MKRIVFAAVLLISISSAKAQVKFDAIQVTPQMPKAGQAVSFKFNTKLSPLQDEKKIDIVIYLFNKKGPVVIEPKTIQTGTVYSGNFKLDTNTVCIAFGLSANDNKLKDNNAGNGYIVPVYANNNLPVLDYYPSAGSLYAGYGEYLFGMKNLPEKNLALMEEGLKSYPDAKNDINYFSSYLFALNTAKKKDAEPIIIDHLNNIAAKADITENDFSILTQWYNRLKMKATADSFTVIMKEKFPDGQWKKNEMANTINKEKDAEAKKRAYEAYVKAYPPKKDDMRMINYYKSSIASAYHQEKNYEAFKTWAKALPVNDKASLYNNLAWDMALTKEELPFAKQISYEATSWAKKQMTTPTEKKPDHLTKKQWGDQRENQYGMYADTYALILYHLGDNKNGYQYAKEAAAINKFKNSEYNERYTQLLVKVTPADMAKKEIERFVEEGSASSATKEILKELYIKVMHSEAGYDTYLTKLEMAAKERRREELVKEMINEEAPKFSLKDFAGNDISLAGLKGKVVIADFWATWCGPCIASMPAMKKAQEKLTANGDVAFVFIDTWESAENKKQNAEDFMKKNNYPFHVLMDDNDKVVADFKVNGIPTKFIIDKTGNIRFKSVGWNGNDDALIDELSMMVEMAAVDIPVSTNVK